MLLVSAPVLGMEEKAALAAVIESGWITMGDRVREFEQAFALIHEAEDSDCRQLVHCSPPFDPARARRWTG